MEINNETDVAKAKHILNLMKVSNHITDKSFKNMEMTLDNNLNYVTRNLKDFMDSPDQNNS
jgi:hypothetical protein